MKIPGKEEVGEYGQSLMKGFGEGFAAGIPVALGIRYLLDRRTAFKNAGAFPRTLFLIAPPVFIGATWMEVRSREFEEIRRNNRIAAHRAGLTPAAADAAGTVAAASNTRAQLDTGITSWIADNKYKCIIAGWAAVLGGSFWQVNKDPYLTRSQKIVQARVWAQGATVIMLVASVLLSVGSNAESKDQAKQEARNSWIRHLEQNK